MSRRDGQRRTAETLVASAVAVNGLTLQAGQFKGPDGTAAAPTYSFTSAANAGVALVSAALALAQGGSSRQSVSSNNNSQVRLSASAVLTRTPFAQTLATVGTTVLTTTSHALLTGTAASPGAMTAVPNITAGNNGDEFTVTNVGANTITLQDETVVAGSKIRAKVPGTGVVLTQYQSRTFLYNTTTGAWHEQ